MKLFETIFKNLFNLKEKEVAIICYHTENDNAKFSKTYIANSIEDLVDFVIKNRGDKYMTFSPVKRVALTSEKIITGRKQVPPVQLDAVVIDLDFKNENGLTKGQKKSLIREIVNSIKYSRLWKHVIYIADSGMGCHIAFKVEVSKKQTLSKEEIKSVMKYIFDLTREVLINNIQFMDLVRMYGININKLFDTTAINYDKLIRIPMTINEKYNEMIDPVYIGKNPEPMYVDLKQLKKHKEKEKTIKVHEIKNLKIDNDNTKNKPYQIAKHYYKNNNYSEFQFVADLTSSMLLSLAEVKEDRFANTFASLFILTNNAKKQTIINTLKALGVDESKIKYWYKYFEENIPTNILEITLHWLLEFVHRHYDYVIDSDYHEVIYAVVKRYYDEIPRFDYDIINKLSSLIPKKTIDEIRKEINQYINEVKDKSGVHPLFAATGSGKTHALLSNLKDKKVLYLVPSKALQHTVETKVKKLGLDNVEVMTIQKFTINMDNYICNLDPDNKFPEKKRFLFKEYNVFSKSMINEVFGLDIDVIVVDEMHEIRKLINISKSYREKIKDNNFYDLVYMSLRDYIDDYLITRDETPIDTTVFAVTATPPVYHIAGDIGLAKWLFVKDKEIDVSYSNTSGNGGDKSEAIVDAIEEIHDNNNDKTLVFINNKKVLAKVESILQSKNNTNVVSIHSEVDKDKILSNLPDTYVLLTTSSILSGYDSDINKMVIYVDSYFYRADDIIQLVGRIRHKKSRIHIIFDKNVPVDTRKNVINLLSNMYKVKYIKTNLKDKSNHRNNYTHSVENRNKAFINKIGITHPTVTRKELVDLYLRYEDRFATLDKIFGSNLSVDTWYKLIASNRFRWSKSKRFYTTITTVNKKSAEIVHDAYLEVMLLNAGYLLRKNKKMDKFVKYDINSRYYYAITNDNKRLYIVDEDNVMDIRQIQNIKRKLTLFEEYNIDNYSISLYQDSDENIWMFVNLIKTWTTNNSMFIARKIQNRDANIIAN